MPKIKVNNVHIAGEYQNRIQRCYLCGELLIDNRNTDTPDGSQPGFYLAGTYVEKYKSKNSAGTSRISPDVCEMGMCRNA